MMRIKLLPGGRASTTDVYTTVSDEFEASIGDNSVETLIVNATRWLEGETLSSVSEASGFISVSLASPIATLTITGSQSRQYADIDLTTSAGRKRRIRITARGDNYPDFDDEDYDE